MEVSQHLMQFKDRGVILFDRVLAIPFSERIPELIKQPDGFMRVSTALTASLKSAMDNINLRIGLSEDQIIEIACMLIEQSSEDFLSLEDILLFLKELLLGKMGKIYDRLDIPTFFELLETYRDKRHKELIRIRNEEISQHKALPVNDRLVDLFPESERGMHRAALMDYMKTQSSREQNELPIQED